MAKAKEYMGESYTDSAGKQWRWDGKTYVRNFGTSPMASIKRSWNQKIVPAAQQYAERQTRLTNEALGKSKSKSPKEEAMNWFKAVIEDPSISDQVRTPLVQANFGMQNAFELEDSDTMTWVQAMQMQESNPDLSENIAEVKKENEEDYKEEPGDVETFAEAQAARDEDKQFRASSSVEDSKKTTFLEDTADSPAAKAGLDDDLRWQARQRHEDFLKKREVKSSLGKAK